MRIFFGICVFCVVAPLWAAQGPGRAVPVIYSTDLFHPPDDPDDHFDLATLFALPELDIRAIILDLGQQQLKNSGELALRQMMYLTGRQVPFAPGLLNPLRYPEDRCADQFSPGGVDLILRALEESKSPVTIITTGSVRDIAAAFNRLPSLFREKVQRIYINAGNSAGGDLHWNPRLDPQAYIRLMQSDLPIYWAPSFGGPESFATLAAGKLSVQQHQTYWRFRQGDLLGALPSGLQNFFLYALGRKDPSLSDPVAYLQGSPEEALYKQQWGQVRNMWSTVTLLDAAGRIFVRKGDEWATLPGPAPASGELKIFDFVPTALSIDRDLRTALGLSRPNANFRVFHLLDVSNYERAMLSSLKRLLAEMPLQKR